MQKSNIMQFGKLTLAALLALQLAFAVKLYWGKQQAQREMSKPHALFDLAADDIDRITINDGSASVTLQHTDGGWHLPDDQGLPADSPKVDSLVSSVAGLSPSWPVATTASSQQQLEVAADNFQRRVVLYSGEQEAGELLLGTSPGFKHTHARRADSDAIYSVALNNHAFATSSSEWLDKTLLSSGEVTGIQGADFALQKQGDSWLFAPTDDTDESSGSAIDADKAAQLAAAFNTLRVQDVADSKPEGKAIAFTVSTDTGDFTYQFTEQEEQYFVSRNDVTRNDTSDSEASGNEREVSFTVSKFDYERIASIGRQQLDPQSNVAPVEGDAPADDLPPAAEPTPQPADDSKQAAGVGSPDASNNAEEAAGEQLPAEAASS